MTNETIKIFTRDELQNMDKNLLVERNLLMDHQLKIRIEMGKDYSEVVDLSLEMLKLQQFLIDLLCDKFDYPIQEDSELVNQILSVKKQISDIARFVRDNHGNLEYLKQAALDEYMKSEWLDGKKADE